MNRSVVNTYWWWRILQLRKSWGSSAVCIYYKNKDINESSVAPATGLFLLPYVETKKTI